MRGRVTPPVTSRDIGGMLRAERRNRRQPEWATRPGRRRWLVVVVLVAVVVAGVSRWDRADAAVPAWWDQACTVIVEPGDTLYSIAEDRLGSGDRWAEIAAHNPDLIDPDVIEVGQLIFLCEPTHPAAVTVFDGLAAETAPEPLPRYVSTAQRWVTTDDGTPWPGILTPVGVADCAWHAGWRGDDLVTAVAVARGESSFTPGALGDEHMIGRATNDGRTWGMAIGLYQVLSIWEERGTGNPRDPDRLTDPQFNCDAAYSIWEERGDWSAWYAWERADGTPGPAQSAETLTIARQAVADLFDPSLEPAP